MTVSTITVKTTPAAGDGANKTWPFSFPVYNDTDLVPYLIDSTGNAVQITTDFSISLNADQQTSPGGTVTYPVVAAAITSSYKVQLVRETPKTQALDLTHGGNFNDENVEAALDRMATQIQEISEAVTRALRVKLGDTSGVDPLVPTLVANYFLTADSAGTGLTWAQAVTATVTISSWIENNILNLGSGAAVLTAIGGIGLADDNVFTGKNDFASTVSWKKGTDITVADVAAGALTLPDDGNYYDFTDATDISSIGTLGAGTNAIIVINFTAGGNVLTHGANLDLITGANITTVAGDVAWFIESATGTWTMINYARANGSSLAAGRITPRDQYRNLVVTRPSVSTVTVTADELVVQTTAGASVVLPSVNVTPNITASGANGLDTGAEAAVTWYYIWVIYNPTTGSVAGLLSASSTTPTLPSGYTHKALVGAVYNNATPDFVDFKQVNHNVVYRELVTVLTGVAGGSAWTGLSMAAFFPPTATVVRIVSGGSDHVSGIAPYVDGTPDGFGGSYEARADNAAGTQFGSVFTSSRGNWSTHDVQYNSTIYYYQDSTSLELYAIGWEY